MVGQVVWVVESGDREMRMVAGVYSSLHAAQEAHPLDVEPCNMWEYLHEAGHEAHRWERGESDGIPYYYNLCRWLEITPFTIDG